MKLQKMDLKTNINYNPYKKLWVMDLGEIHGVKNDHYGENLENEKIVLPNLSSPFDNARIENIYSNYSEIKFPYLDEQDLPSLRHIKGDLDGFLAHPTYINVDLNGESKGISRFREIIFSQEKYLQRKKLFFSDDLVPLYKDKKIGYSIKATNNCYSISKFGEEKTPFAYIHGYSTESIQKTLKIFQQISQWNYIKTLTNYRNNFVGDLLCLTIYSKGKEIARCDGETPFNEFDLKTKRITFSSLKFKFENQAGTNLYVSCIRLDDLFGSEVDTFSPSVIEFARSGPESVITLDSKIISNSFLKSTYPNEINLSLKMIISPEPFDVYHF